MAAVMCGRIDGPQRVSESLYVAISTMHQYSQVKDGQGAEMRFPITSFLTEVVQLFVILNVVAILDQFQSPCRITSVNAFAILSRGPSFLQQVANNLQLVPLLIRHSRNTLPSRFHTPRTFSREDNHVLHIRHYLPNVLLARLSKRVLQSPL